MSTFTPTSSSKPRIILICTGLGRVNRGFEQHISTLGKRLSEQSPFVFDVEIWGGGHFKNDLCIYRKIVNIPRAVFQAFHFKKAFLWEQRTFFIFMIPMLIKRKPVVIYLGEYELYCYLFKLRSLLKLDFGLALYTGGFAIPGMKLFDKNKDFVHHVNTELAQQADYLPAIRQRFLPHFVEFDFQYDCSLYSSIRSAAGSKKVVLCIGAVNKAQKRTDVIIRALKLTRTPIFPIVLGQKTQDWAEVQHLLEQNFGSGQFILDSVPRTKLGTYYQLGDLMVHGSDNEIFGMVFVEAMFHGLSVLAPNKNNTQDLFDSNVLSMDAGTPGSIAKAIDNYFTESDKQFPKSSVHLHEYAVKKFSWDALSKKYVELFADMSNTSESKRTN